MPAVSFWIPIETKQPGPSQKGHSDPGNWEPNLVWLASGEPNRNCIWMGLPIVEAPNLATVFFSCPFLAIRLQGTEPHKKHRHVHLTRGGGPPAVQPRSLLSPPFPLHRPGPERGTSSRFRFPTPPPQCTLGGMSPDWVPVTVFGVSLRIDPCTSSAGARVKSPAVEQSVR